MRRTRSALFVGLVALALLHSSNAGAMYHYFLGPNQLNASGAACRVENDYAGAANVKRAANEITANAGSVQLFCPLNRRNTTFYERVRESPANPSNNRERTITAAGAVWVHGQNVSSQDFRCFTFASNLSTGSISFGSTRFLCSANGGCPISPSPVFQGTNFIQLGFAVDGVTQTVDYGYTCQIGYQSKVLNASFIVTPNN